MPRSTAPRYLAIGTLAGLVVGGIIAASTTSHSPISDPASRSPRASVAAQVAHAQATLTPVPSVSMATRPAPRDRRTSGPSTPPPVQPSPARTTRRAPASTTRALTAAQKAAARAAAQRRRTAYLHRTTPTGWVALNEAIWRIPNYRPAYVHWSVLDKGAWGATDLDTQHVYIAPRTPTDRLYDVVSHEYAHVLQGRLYGSMQAAINAAARWYGTSSEKAIEYQADCAARLEGARWTWYTPCQDSRWRYGAQLLLRGQRLP